MGGGVQYTLTGDFVSPHCMDINCNVYRGVQCALKGHFVFPHYVCRYLIYIVIWGVHFTLTEISYTTLWIWDAIYSDKELGTSTIIMDMEIKWNVGGYKIP